MLALPTSRGASRLSNTTSGAKSVVLDRSNPEVSIQPAVEKGNMISVVISVVRDTSNLEESTPPAVELGNMTAGVRDRSNPGSSIQPAARGTRQYDFRRQICCQGQVQSWGFGSAC